MSSTLPSRSATAIPDASRSLTSLRFLGALYVVFYHTLDPMAGPVSRYPGVPRILSLAYGALSFFFFLSGYILSVAHLVANRNIEDKRRFYVARFARVYPLFLLTLVLDTPDWFVAHARSFGGYVAAIGPTAGVFLEHVFMLQAWIPWQRGIDRPNWSLSVEAFLYILFPFAAIEIWKLGRKGIVIFAAGLWLVQQVVVFLAAPHLSADTLMFLPVFHMPTFLLGMSLARWQQLDTERIQSWSNAFVVSLFLLSMILSAGFLVWPGIVPKQILNDGILAPIFALLILSVSVNGRTPAKLLAVWPLRELGDASYALYLFHVPIFHLVQRLHLPHLWSLYILYLAVCIGISVLSFHFFETPWRARISRSALLRGKPMKSPARHGASA